MNHLTFDDADRIKLLSIAALYYINKNALNDLVMNESQLTEWLNTSFSIMTGELVIDYMYEKNMLIHDVNGTKIIMSDNALELLEDVIIATDNLNG